jgi:hypothetical protein
MNVKLLLRLLRAARPALTNAVPLLLFLVGAIGHLLASIIAVLAPAVTPSGWIRGSPQTLQVIGPSFIARSFVCNRQKPGGWMTVTLASPLTGELWRCLLVNIRYYPVQQF